MALSSRSKRTVENDHVFVIDVFADGEMLAVAPVYLGIVAAGLCGEHVYYSFGHARMGTSGVHQKYTVLSACENDAFLLVSCS